MAKFGCASLRLAESEIGLTGKLVNFPDPGWSTCADHGWSTSRDHGWSTWLIWGGQLPVILGGQLPAITGTKDVTRRCNTATAKARGGEPNQPTTTKPPPLEERNADTNEPLARHH